MKFRLLLLSFLLTISIFASHQNSLTPISSEPHSLPKSFAMAGPSSQNVTIFVTPNATIDLSRSQQKITVEVGLNNTGPNGPRYNAISIILSYNPHVLWAVAQNVQVGKLDYSTNVFSAFSSVAVLRDCLDGIAADNGGTNLCGSDDHAGRISFAETMVGGSTPNGTEGNIFLLTLVANTTAPNFSQISIDQAIISLGSVPVPSISFGGYYTSFQCGNGSCSSAKADFRFLPKIPVQGNFTVFYGNSSVATGGATITDYFWQFGDTNSLRPFVDTGKNSTASYVYTLNGTYLVTLTITDSLHVKASKTVQITVINANVDMGVESLDVEPSTLGLHAGLVFTITAILKNYGGLVENSSLSLSITVNAKAIPLGNFSAMNVKPATDRTYSTTWNSTGVPPNVYRVEANIPLLKNELSNDPNPNRKSFWIQLIPIQPSGGLTLLGTAGLSVLVLGAGGAGVSFLRKRTRNVDDSL